MVLKHISDPKIQDGRQIWMEDPFFQAKQNLIPLQGGMNSTVNIIIDECIALNNNLKLQNKNIK